MALPIPLNRAALMTTQSCVICRHLLVGDDSMFCQIYDEHVLLPSVAAEDCPSFEESKQ